MPVLGILSYNGAMCDCLREGKYITLPSCNFCISNSVLKIGITIIDMLHNCTMDETIHDLLLQQIVYVELAVTVIMPHALHIMVVRICANN